MQSCSEASSKSKNYIQITVVVLSSIYITIWIVIVILVYYQRQMRVCVCHCHHQKSVFNKCLQKKKLFKRDTTTTTTTLLNSCTQNFNFRWCGFMNSNRMMMMPRMNVIVRGTLYFLLIYANHFLYFQYWFATRLLFFSVYNWFLFFNPYLEKCYFNNEHLFNNIASTISGITKLFI